MGLGDRVCQAHRNIEVIIMDNILKVNPSATGDFTDFVSGQKGYGQHAVSWEADTIPVGVRIFLGGTGTQPADRSRWGIAWANLAAEATSRGYMWIGLAYPNLGTDVQGDLDGPDGIVPRLNALVLHLQILRVPMPPAFVGSIVDYTLTSWGAHSQGTSNLSKLANRIRLRSADYLSGPINGSQVGSAVKVDAFLSTTPATPTTSQTAIWHMADPWAPVIAGCNATLNPGKEFVLSAVDTVGSKAPHNTPLADGFSPPGYKNMAALRQAFWYPEGS